MELWGGKLVVVENAGTPFYSNLVKARRKTGVNESNTFELFQYKRHIKKCPTCNKIQIMKM